MSKNQPPKGSIFEFSSIEFNEIFNAFKKRKYLKKIIFEAVIRIEFQ